MKRLLCFFDGTWNVPDGRMQLTNVVKLARFVLGTAPDGVAQISRYIEGIGTDPGDGPYEAFIEGAIGAGVDRRILAGYRFLAERYEPGDEIYLFGFSRGAFQARSLAELVGEIGLIHTNATGELHEDWSAYIDKGKPPWPDRMARLGSLTHRGVRIRCLGVWDTVGNIGIPFVGGHTWTGNVAVHDTELSPQVDIGLQALAIDEPRGPFSPSLWTRHRGAALPPAQTIEQVWFAGSHANVGGGFTDCSLSDIPLVWMAERASALTGVAFDMRRLQSNAACDPLGELVDPTAEGIYRTSRMLPFLRLIHQVEAGIPPWRRRVIGTWRTNRLAAFLETVNESIHPSVLERLDRPARSRFGNTTQQVAYHPRSLVCALERRCGVT